MSIDYNKAKMDICKEIALKIHEKEVSSSNGIQQLIGSINTLKRVSEKFNIYKSSDLSNDKLDEREISPDGHKLLIEGINKCDSIISEELKSSTDRLLILKGQEQAYNLSIDLIEKINAVAEARVKNIEDEIEKINLSEDGPDENKIRKVGTRPESLKSKRNAEEAIDNKKSKKSKKGK